MNEATTIRFVGLDVHRDSIAIAVAMRDGKPAESLGTVPNDVPGLIRRLQRLGPAESLRCCYEAGPTGFGLARRLNDGRDRLRGHRPVARPGPAGGPGQDRPPRRPEARPVPPLGRPHGGPRARPGHRGDPRPRAGPRRRQAGRAGRTAPTLEVPPAARPLVRGQVDVGAGPSGLAGEATVRQQGTTGCDERLSRGGRAGDGTGRPADRAAGRAGGGLGEGARW